MCKCIFDTKVFRKGCHALTELMCDKTSKCPFYKPCDKYELTYDGYVKEKGEE